MSDAINVTGTIEKPAHGFPRPISKNLKPKFVARITIVERVNHQEPTQQPTQIVGSYSKKLTTDEQPYGPRRMKVTKEGVRLESGWLEKASLVCLMNESPDGKVEIGFEVERSDNSDPMVQYFLDLPHQESNRIIPLNLKGVWLRSVGIEESKVRVTVFPT